MSALPGDPDPAAEAVAVHRGDHRDLAVVHRGERLVATAVDPDERFIGRVGGEFLDVDTALEPAAFGVDDHHAYVGVAAGAADRVGECVPPGDRERVDRWVVDGDQRDVITNFGPEHGPEYTNGARRTRRKLVRCGG